MDEETRQRILHLYIVEKLSIRQIARQLKLSRKTVVMVINDSHCERIEPVKVSNLDSYKSLIWQWYKEYPLLKSKQVYERLKEYGYTGLFQNTHCNTGKRNPDTIMN